MSETSLVEEILEWIQQQKPLYLATKTATLKATDYVRFLVVQNWPIICSWSVYFGRQFLVVSELWINCSLRGMGSLLHLSSTAYFVLLWCTVLSTTSMSGLFFVLISLGIAYLAEPLLGFAPAIIIIATLGATMLWIYGSFWITGFKTSKYDSEEGNVIGEPMSPGSQSLSTSVMSLGINIILEFEQPIVDIDRTKTRLADALLPKIPRFSCILTVNDVMCGIIFSGFQRYVQTSLSTGGEQSLKDVYEKRPIPNDIKEMKDKRATALTMINTRTLAGLENLEEMMKPNTQIQWGNHYAMLQIPIPLKNMENPLQFVKMAKCMIDRQKMSLGVFSSTKILGYLGRFGGAKALSKCAYKTIASSTMVISNMIGPKEKIAIDANIVKRFSFFVSGGPITLAVFIISYMDTITVQVVAQKDYIDIDMILNLFKEAFQEIKEASIHCK